MNDNGKILVRDGVRLAVWCGAFFLAKYFLFKSLRETIEETIKDTEIVVKVGRTNG